MDEGLAGRVVLVTGAGSGIGRATAQALLGAGACVGLVDIEEDGIREIADSFASSALAVRADVSDVRSCENAVRAVADRFEGLDVLANCAGVQPPASYVSVEELDPAMWEYVLRVNLTGTFLMARSAIPEILKREGGVIVNVASVQGSQSMPWVSAYAASKGGVLSLTRAMALDLAPKGIRVNSVSPGITDTPLVWQSVEVDEIRESRERFSGLVPLGRIGKPEDIATMILFLIGSRARYITGQDFIVDGGLMALGAWAQGPGAE